MTLIKNIIRIILIIFLLIILFTPNVFSQTIEVELVCPGSMHATHYNPDGGNEDNGGFGIIATVNGEDKKYNLGVGRIYFINSLNDPGYVDILQLMEIKFEYKYLIIGSSIWKMWVYGYFDTDDESFVIGMPPLPVLFIRGNPFYFLDKNVFFSFRCVNFLTVSITFFSVNYRF